MNFLGPTQGFRKLSSDRQTDRQTDVTEIIYDAASRVVKYGCLCLLAARKFREFT